MGDTIRPLTWEHQWWRYHGFLQPLHSLSSRPRALQTKHPTDGGPGGQRNDGGEFWTATKAGHRGGRLRTRAKTGLNRGRRFRIATKTGHYGEGGLRTPAETGYH